LSKNVAKRASKVRWLWLVRCLVGPGRLLKLHCARQTDSVITQWCPLL